MDIRIGKQIDISIELPALKLLETSELYNGGNFIAKNKVKVRISPSIPNKSGVYFLIGADEQVLYIGKAVNIRSRVNKHTKQRSFFDIEAGRGISHKLIKNISWLLIEDEAIRDIIETAYLNKIPTAFNIDKISSTTLGITAPPDPELEDPEIKNKIKEYKQIQHKLIMDAWDKANG